ncbi:Uroporphyrinogen-III synthase [Flavobacterium longum]|uniref:uroporphyrinogen-III synthase n=1 Tax=Flavobacterium longum TaxID=1299340 RepID=UPI0039EC55F3
MIRILSTKKLPVNQKQFLLNAGFSVVDADFIQTQPVAFALRDIKQNLIFTSANAVRSVADHPQVQDIRRKPCFATSGKTAEVLDEVGFTVIETADDAAGLGMIINEKYPKESFTFFCGNLRMETLPVWFGEWNIDYNEIPVYETTLTPVKVSETDGVLFFSPSGVESFLQTNTLGKQTCFCIGETTAKALKDKTDKIIIANKPSVENVIVQCINYFVERRTTDVERPDNGNRI